MNKLCAWAYTAAASRDGKYTHDVPVDKDHILWEVKLGWRQIVDFSVIDGGEIVTATLMPADWRERDDTFIPIELGVCEWDEDE